MTRKLIITTIAGTAFYLIFGWIVFDLLLGPYTDQHTTQLIGFKKKEESFNLTLLVFSCGAYAALLSYVLVYLLRMKQLVKAFFIGSTIGILVAIMTDFYWLASSNFYSNWLVVLLDIMAAGLTVGLLGLVIASINKRLSKIFLE